MVPSPPLWAVLGDVLLCLGAGLLLGAVRDGATLAFGSGPVRCFVWDVLAFAAAAFVCCGFAAGASATGAARWYMAAAMGLEAGDVVRQVAYVACCGDSECVSPRHEYVGIKSCSAAQLLYAGDSRCTYSCLGYGDCAAVCPNNAIEVRDTLARINPVLCVGCGLCAKTCPNHVIHIVPENIRTFVRCSNHDKGAVTRSACKIGCIGCKKCERECPAGAITVVNNLAVIDYDKCTHCGHCKEICTTGCITEASFAAARKS